MEADKPHFPSETPTKVNYIYIYSYVGEMIPKSLCLTYHSVYLHDILGPSEIHHIFVKVTAVLPSMQSTFSLTLNILFC